MLELYYGVEGFKIRSWQLSFQCEYCGALGHHRCLGRLLDRLEHEIDEQLVQELQEYQEELQLDD